MNYMISPMTGGRDPEVSRDSMVSSYEYDEEFEMLVAAFLRDMNYTSVNQTALNIIYSMINAGLIALPYAASQGGVIFYSALILVISLMSAYTSVIVISMANEQKVRTLEDLAECAFGPRGFFAVSFFQMLFSFALMAITLDAYSDIMVDVFTASPYQSWILTNRVGQLIVGSVIVVPLCVLKTSMSNMKWTSYVTVTAMCAALIAVICTYLSDHDGSSVLRYADSTASVAAPKSNWWFTMFLAVFSFSCNQKVMTVYSSLRQRSIGRWQSAVKRAYTGLTLLYLFFGVFGYLSVKRMGYNLENVNFFVDDGYQRGSMFDPARVTVAFALLLTIPVDCLVAATTWRRFHSKYMKIYHCQAPMRASPLPTFFDKCMVRLSIVSSSVLTHHDVRELSTRDGDPAHEDRDPFLADEPALAPPLGESVDAALVNHDSTRQRSAVRSVSSSLAPPLAMAASAPSRFTRRSKPFYPHAQRMRSASNISSTGRPSVLSDADHYSSSLGSGRIHEAPEESIDSSRQSESEERMVDESGWKMYSTLLAGNAATLAAQYEEANRASPALAAATTGAGSTGDVSAEELLARRLTYTDRAAALQDSVAFNNSQSYHFDLPEGDESSWWYYWYQLSPALILYTLCFLTCCGIQHWLYLAASVCTLSTAILLFIFPSILYFRLGLMSDYQSIPLIYNVLPNQVYMYIIQITGMVFIGFDVLLLFYFIVKGEHFVESQS